MIQLIEPNLPGKGYLARCLGYVQGVYGVPEKRYSADIPWAMQVWEHADQHTGLPPTDVKVPLWFSWSGTVDGVYRNWGHVVVNVPGVGLYSSPMKTGENNHIFNSIQSVENFLGAKYLGWSTDVYNVKVVGENMETSKQKPDLLTIQLAYNIGLFRQPTDEEIKGWDTSGFSTEQLMRTILDSDEHKSFQVKIDELSKALALYQAANGELTKWLAVKQILKQVIPFLS